jgi:hypothetical protein
MGNFSFVWEEPTFFEVWIYGQRFAWFITRFDPDYFSILLALKQITCHDKWRLFES